MLKYLVGVYDSIFGHVNILYLLNNNIVLWFDIVIEKSVIVFKLDVLAKEP